MKFWRKKKQCFLEYFNEFYSYFYIYIQHKTTNIFIWMLLIFLARVGATTTETENYAYFYKK